MTATIVKAGDIVVRLDDTVTKANLAIVTKNLDGLLARGLRGCRPNSRASTRSCFPRRCSIMPTTPMSGT